MQCILKDLQVLEHCTNQVLELRQDYCHKFKSPKYARSMIILEDESGSISPCASTRPLMLHKHRSYSYYTCCGHTNTVWSANLLYKYNTPELCP